MEAKTLNCPMCGAAAATDASRCDHCGARLATVACPSCFGLMFLGAKFCSHCGAEAARTEVSNHGTQLCPRCKVALNAVLIGKANLGECPRCEGIWADTASLEQLYADRERQAAVLGLTGTVSTPGSVELETNIHYVPCPTCRNLMNRVNFAQCSNVIVDVCKQHGTWFDKDELRRIVEFIRSGGLEKAHTREIAELDRRRRQLSATQMSSASAPSMDPSESNHEYWEIGIAAAAALLRTLLR